jgi:hypothetical protein
LPQDWSAPVGPIPPGVAAGRIIARRGARVVLLAALLVQGGLTAPMVLLGTQPIGLWLLVPALFGRSEGAFGEGFQHFLAGHRRGRQKAVDRQFPGSRLTPSLRITSDPVAVTRSNSSVPTAARRTSPK